MTNFEAVSGVTDNIESALKKLGINFVKSSIEGVERIPASLIPLGQIFYGGEEFENQHGQRPSYVEAEFLIKVIFTGKDASELVRSQQAWVHRIKGALTIEALNSGRLAAEKPVSRVNISRARAENGKSASAISVTLRARYREL